MKKKITRTHVARATTQMCIEKMPLFWDYSKFSCDKDGESS